MSERFYLNSPLAEGLVELDGAEAHHLFQVCRLRPGDVVSLFNGDGREYQGRIDSATKKAVLIVVDTISAPARELPFSLEIAAPLPKGDRTQFLIEKLTELGVTAFVPLLTQRSVIHPGDGKLERLERYVIEASKQCGRNRLMRIEPPTHWRDYRNPRGMDELRLIAHPGGDARPAAHASVRCVLGPEGGLTAQELGEADAAGWLRLGLGACILRIETAALVAAARLIG